MRNRFDQIGKRILRGALEPGGAVANQLEVPSADAQAVDTWFEPAPERAARLERAGLLGRMATGPTMFESFHDTPGVDQARECLRKQLALDHARVLDARKQGVSRPPFPKLWMLSSGRPASLLQGYRLTSVPSFPAGFYEGPEAMAVGVVVLKELPRDRDTLLLRLMGAGALLKEALAELARLPEQAWERQVAIPALLAVRVQIPQDSSDEGEREYLMSTQNLYEEWERTTRERGREEGREQGREQEAKRALAVLYEARFGPMPRPIADAIEAARDVATLERWLVLVGTRPQEAVAAAILAESAALES
jgi:hypothetical protein